MEGRTDGRVGQTGELTDIRRERERERSIEREVDRSEISGVNRLSPINTRKEQYYMRTRTLDQNSAPPSIAIYFYFPHWVLPVSNHLR